MNLKEKYLKQALPQLKAKFGIKNDFALPRIEKVVINSGLGRVWTDEKIKESIMADLGIICGQKPVFRPAKKAISAFKTRQGSIIGVSVTLRGDRMYSFLDRLINVALPRSRDFRGLPLKNIDQHGNLNIGLKEQIIFPEISAESARSIFGFEVTVKTTGHNREQALEMYKILGFPFQKNG